MEGGGLTRPGDVEPVIVEGNSQRPTRDHEVIAVYLVRCPFREVHNDPRRSDQMKRNVGILPTALDSMGILPLIPRREQVFDYSLILGMGYAALKIIKKNII